MPTGFFSESIALASKAPKSTVPKCGACGLFKKCKSPKMRIDGKGKRKILIVGEAPGRDEDKEGRPFVGVSGQRLRRAMAGLGVDLRADCWLTNALLCHPKDNRTPTPLEIDYCQPNIGNAIKKLNPITIITLGGVATTSVLTYLGQERASITTWAGWNIPHRDLNAWICPTFHPSFLERMKDQAADALFLSHLKKAVSYKRRPWEHEPPDLEKTIQRVVDDSVVAKELKYYAKEGGSIAFDYETNMLKPDTDDAQIVSCAVCWNGLRTIAYPWTGKAIKATGELLKSDIGKIGSNISFEDGWTKKEFGFWVNNWIHDTTLGAHIIDNREGISGLKFQAFALLGMNSYNDHIEPFLKAKGGNQKNRIKSVDLDQLLAYNGLDAYLEYCVAQVQMAQIQVMLSRWW